MAPTLCWPILLLMLCVSASLHAEPTAADKESARSLMAEGDLAYANGNYQRAMVSYEAAHALVQLPSTGIWVARTRAALGRLVEARDMALAVVDLPRAPNEHPASATAREDAFELAANLQRRIPSLEVRVSGNPDVRIDGVALPRAAIGSRRKLDPGPHEVRVSAPGYRAESRRVFLKEGEAASVTITLASMQQPAAPVVQPETQDDSGYRIMTGVGFGVGAAGLIVGAVTGALALERADKAEDRCQENSCEPAAQPFIDASDDFANASNVGLAIGAIGLALGTVGLALALSDDDTITVGLGELRVRGAF